MGRHREDLPLTDRIRIQCEVLVPVVRALERSLGRGTAFELVREGLREEMQDHARDLLERNGGDAAAALMAHFADSSGGDPITVEWHELTDDTARLDVTRCEYAEYFRALGDPELGHLLVCEGDVWLTEALGGVDLRRTGTLMMGADRCDFCYRRREPATPGPDTASA